MRRGTVAEIKALFRAREHEAAGKLETAYRMNGGTFGIDNWIQQLKKERDDRRRA